MTYVNYLPLWKETNKLLSVKLKFAKMNKNIFLGRLIQYDLENCNIQLYLDDQRELYNFQFNEIENISPASLSPSERINLKDILSNKEK